MAAADLRRIPDGRGGAQLFGSGQEAASDPAGGQPGDPPPGGRAGGEAVRSLVAKRRADRGGTAAARVRGAVAASRGGGRRSAVRELRRSGAGAWSSAPMRRPSTRCCRSSSGSRRQHPQVHGRRAARAVPADCDRSAQPGSLDFGVLTFQPAGQGPAVDPARQRRAGDARPIPSIRSRRRQRVSIEEVGRQTVIAHNDPSPARERVLRLYERRHAPINIQISLPSLDGIKRAVEMGLGVAVLPRRCALTEIARGQLVAVHVPELELTASGAVRVQARRRAVARRAGVSGDCASDESR